MLDDNKTQTNDSLRDAIEFALHPTFALLIADVPVARVLADARLDAWDAIALELFQRTNGVRTPTVYACQLEQAEMDRLPWYTDLESILGPRTRPIDIPIDADAVVADAATPASPKGPRRRPVRSNNSYAHTRLGAPGHKPWPDHVRKIPSCLLRCGLFHPARSGMYLRKSIKLGTLGGIEASVRGWHPTQTDLDVFLAALHLARRGDDGTLMTASIVEFVNAVGRKDSADTRKNLIRSLRGLKRTDVTISEIKSTVSFSGTLLEEVSIDRARTGDHIIRFRIPAAFYALFGGAVTPIDLAARRKVARCPLAAWLQAFSATHSYRPHPIFATRYRELSGLNTPQFTFNDMIRKAMKTLVKKEIFKAEHFDEFGKVYLFSPDNAMAHSKKKKKATKTASKAMPIEKAPPPFESPDF